MPNRVAFDARASEHFADDGRAQLSRRHGGERASEIADRSTNTACNYDFPFHFALQHIRMMTSPNRL